MNERFSSYKILHHNWKEIEYPIHIQIDPVGICNHRCVFCFFREGVRNPGHLRYDVRKTPYLNGEVILRAVREFKEIEVKAITFVGGGEPLLHPEIEEILQGVIDSGMEFGIITNLSKLVAVDLLSKASWIRVSVDAATSNIYKVVHNPKNSNFEDLIDNVKKLVNKVDLGISFVVCKENFKEIYEAANLFKNIGINYIQYKPAYDIDRAESIRPYLDEINVLLKDAEGLITDGFEVINLISRVGDISRSRRNFKMCRIHNYNIQLGVDGHIYPCCVLKYMNEYSYGSLYENDFKEIWQGERRKRKEVMHRLTAENCPPCWYDKTNEIMEYLANKEARHKNFV